MSLIADVTWWMVVNKIYTIVWLHPLIKSWCLFLANLFFIDSLSVALSHWVDYRQEEIDDHYQENVTKHLLQSAGLLAHKTRGHDQQTVQNKHWKNSSVTRWRKENISIIFLKLMHNERRTFFPTKAPVVNYQFHSPQHDLHEVHFRQAFCAVVSSECPSTRWMETGCKNQCKECSCGWYRDMSLLVHHYMPHLTQSTPLLLPRGVRWRPVSQTLSVPHQHKWGEKHGGGATFECEEIIDCTTMQWSSPVMDEVIQKLTL